MVEVALAARLILLEAQEQQILAVAVFTTEAELV
jgi:hypothetical protein